MLVAALCLIAALPAGALAADSRSCGEVGIARGPLVFDEPCTVERAVLFEDVAHYRFVVRVGPGEHDRIGLHRVVEERSPWRPKWGLEGLVMVPSVGYGFEGLYLASKYDPGTPRDHSLPVFLASNGYDVWGIDPGWSLVPHETSDFAFMEHWGMERDARDVLLGVTIARLTRLATGSGFGRVHLLGSSTHSMVGYVAAQMEASHPPSFRQIKGFIGVDAYFDCEACEPYACYDLAVREAELAEGVFVESFGSLYALMGQLAATAPDDPSPLYDGFTNRGLVLTWLSQTWIAEPENPHYHYFAGVFGDDGLAVDFRFTPVNRVLSSMMHAAPHTTNRIMADWDRELCGDGDTPLDDLLGDVTIPVLHVGSGGGTGDHGLASLELLGSEDVTAHIVRLYPPEDPYPYLDFGHVDLWFADNAEELVWQPILDWLQAHRHGGHTGNPNPWTVRTR